MVEGSVKIITYRKVWKPLVMMTTLSRLANVYGSQGHKDLKAHILKGFIKQLP